MLGKCFRSCSSCGDPRISPLTPQYECPRLSLLIITSASENQQNRSEDLIPLFHAPLFRQSACFEHSNFFKVNLTGSKSTQLRAPMPSTVFLGRNNSNEVIAPLSLVLRSNYELLTATTLIYAIGAGITAAAGTRLALQWILVKGFELYSFQLRSLKRVPYRYFSSLPPRAGSG